MLEFVDTNGALESANDSTMGLIQRNPKAALPQRFGLDLKKVGLNRGGATKAPQQRCEPKHQLARYGCFGAVVGDDCSLECLVVFGVFQTSNHGLGCQSVPDSVDA